MHYACTTQVPNRLFDELLRTLSGAELKVFLAVNRATWGWVAGKTGKRKERAWLACSRMQAMTGLSKRAITNATAALVRRRLLCVFDEHGVELFDPNERRGQTRLFYSLAFPQVDHRPRWRSAQCAEVDQHKVRTIETNRLLNQGTMSLERRPDGQPFTPMAGLLVSSLPARLAKRLSWEPPP